MEDPGGVSAIAVLAARIVPELRDSRPLTRCAFKSSLASVCSARLAPVSRALSTEARMAMSPSGSNPRLRINSIFSPVESRANRDANLPLSSRSTLFRPFRAGALPQLPEQIEHFGRNVFLDRALVNGLERQPQFGPVRLLLLCLHVGPAGTA